MNIKARADGRLLGLALVCLSCTCHAQKVFAERLVQHGLPDPPEPVFIGDIPGMAGMYIHVFGLGIGGEPDAFSGPTIFSGRGSGLEFSWGAGQRDVAATYVLVPEPSTWGLLWLGGGLLWPVKRRR